MSVNWEPQARCTLALPGQTRLRMAAGDTGYLNLVVTGDWIDNGIYVASRGAALLGGPPGAERSYRGASELVRPLQRMLLGRPGALRQVALRLDRKQLGSP
jgi:hypothetical protein